MGVQKATAQSRANKTAIWLYGIMNLVLVICYAVEVMKKSRTIGYFAVFCVLAVVPWLVSFLIYLRDHASLKIQYTIPVGFSIFYLFIIFTTISPVAYVYAMILAVALMPLGNVKMTGIYMSIVSLGNVVQVIYLALTQQLTAQDLPNVEIRVASIIMIGIYLVVGTKVVVANNQDRLDELEQEKQHASGLAQNILNASAGITSNIGTLSDKMNILENTTGQTMSAMEEVSIGTNETAESIQEQMQKTEEIQNTIVRVGESTDQIGADIDAVREELNQSKENIRTLIEQVELSDRANANMSAEMDKLTGYTDQMQSIIDVIDNVTSQTSLLSLNASIEAARAGEAGKGFAVVATEISSLATQTQQATEDITALINNISAELANVIRVINQVISNTKTQNEAAGHTAKSFEAIDRKIEAVYHQTKQTTELMGELERANTAITHGIETISAATEQVTAHSSETLSISTENTKVTEEVGAIIGRLNEMVEQLSGVTGSEEPQGASAAETEQITDDPVEGETADAD